MWSFIECPKAYMPAKKSNSLVVQDLELTYVSVWWKNEGTPGHKRFMFLYPRYCFVLQGQRMVTLSKLCKCMCVYVSLACLLKAHALAKRVTQFHTSLIRTLSGVPTT